MANDTFTLHPEPKRNRYGWYELPTEAGPEKGYQRVTTFAKMLADDSTLTKWKLRMAAAGLVKDPSLYAKMSAYSIDFNGQYREKTNTLIETAIDRAGGSSGADFGDSLHMLSEQVDAGLNPEIPDPWDKDIKAYQDAMTAAGFKVLPDYIERIVALEEFEVAGTLDRIVEFEGELYIGDLKSAKAPMDYPHDIALQLACYANANVMFDPYTFERQEMPEVNKERALVMHLPPGKATCELYWFDIEAGARMLSTCAEVRDWRKAKGLVTTLDNLVYKAKKPAPKPIKVVAPENPTDTQCVECGAEVKPGFAGLSKQKHGLTLCNVHYGQRQVTA